MKTPDSNLLAIFEAEQREHVERLRALLDGAAPAAPASIEEALRRAHTLKGAARAVGIGSIERVAHRLETLFARVRGGALALDARAIASVRRAIDFMDDALASVLASGAEPDPAATLEDMEGAPAAAPPEQPARDAAQAPPPDSMHRPDALVRVNAASIDGLVRSSTQLLAAAAGQLEAAGRLDELALGVAALEREWAGMRRELGREATGSGAGLQQRLNLVGKRLESLARTARALSLGQQRRAWELHQAGERLYSDACAVRMTPAAAIFDPFRKMVRDLARSEGKEVEFSAEGLDAEADRLVLQALKDPIMHLLRNAIAHGIEPPAEREAAGKPRAGSVKLVVETRSGRLRVTVVDDGRGIDFRKVAQIAAARGLVPEGGADSLSRRDLARLLFEPGFSTSTQVTQLAGRGVGLSVVHEQVARLQGEVRLPEREGPGAAFEISAPLSISTHHLVLVACGRQTYAIPARSVAHLCRIRFADVETIDGSQAIRLDGRPVLLAGLAATIGEEPAPRPQDEDGPLAMFVVVLEAGGERAGFVVDRLVDERRAVVKDLGLPPASAGMSTGGVLLEDGNVAVVLSPAALIDRFRRNGKTPRLKAAVEAPRKKAKILVVDDSVTTRSLEKSILEAHGFQVRVSADGVDALSQIRAERPDLVITDMVMPRMDGFELLERIKRDQRLASIPVIVVTSLDREEDQQRGLSLGADAYVVKRKFDQRELLRVVRQIL